MEMKKKWHSIENSGAWTKRELRPNRKGKLKCKTCFCFKMKLQQQMQAQTQSLLMTFLPKMKKS